MSSKPTVPEIYKNEQKTGDVSFADLPPRIIVHEILVHHIFETFDILRISKKEKEFLHFGYFTRDRIRNIWFIFSSAYCYESNTSLLDFKHLVSLDLLDPNNSMIQHLSNVTTEMTCLQNLQISKVFHKFPTFCSHLFSKENCFPNIRSVSLSGREVISFEWKISSKTNIFRRIKELRIDGGGRRGTVVEEVNIGNLFSGNYESLTIRNITFLIPIELRLSNLRNLELGNVKNIFFQELQYQNMKSLDLGVYEGKSYGMFEDFYRSCIRLRMLTIRGSSSSSYDDNAGWKNQFSSLVFRKGKMKFLRRLELLNLVWFSGARNTCFGENLEYLTISNCPSLIEDVYFNREYRKLTTLRFQTTFPVSTRKWRIFENVKVLEWRKQEGDGFVFGEVFERNEELMLENLEDLSVSGWSGLEDGFFEGRKWRKLRVLEFSYCDGVTGDGLKNENLECLKRIKVLHCRSFQWKNVKKRFEGIKLWVNFREF